MPRKAKDSETDPLIEIIAIRKCFIGPPGKFRMCGPGTRYKQFKVRESQLSAQCMVRVDGKPIPRKSYIGNVTAAQSADVVNAAITALQEDNKRLQAQIAAMQKAGVAVDQAQKAAKDKVPAAVFPGEEGDDGEDIEVTGQPTEAELDKLREKADQGKDVL